MLNRVIALSVALSLIYLIPADAALYHSSRSCYMSSNGSRVRRPTYSHANFGRIAADRLDGAHSISCPNGGGMAI
jgi:hypothetical protein